MSNLNADIDDEVNKDTTGEDNLQHSPDARNGDDQADTLLSIYDPKTWEGFLQSIEALLSMHSLEFGSHFEVIKLGGNTICYI